MGRVEPVSAPKKEGLGSSGYLMSIPADSEVRQMSAREELLNEVRRQLEEYGSVWHSGALKALEVLAEEEVVAPSYRVQSNRFLRALHILCGE